MLKTADQIYAERKLKKEERRKYLIENPKVYRNDFDKAFKAYLTERCLDLGLDPENRKNIYNPDFREDFIRSKEGKELALKYSLNLAWDPDGDKPPDPVILSSVKVIWHQDDRIWRNRIRKDSIELAPYRHFGRFLIVEIDLSYPEREINIDLKDWVHQELKDLKITKVSETVSHHELVERPEPRNRDSSFKYGKMEVWKMVEKKRGTFDKSESKILTQLAKELCESEGWDESYGEFEDDPESEERVKARRKALKAAYERDKKLYYGENIFRGIS
jgi:hypothetical protein